MDKPKVIGITGGSGSGKTYFVKKLTEQLPNTSVHSMDNYYIDRFDQPKDKNGIENFDTITSINSNKFTNDLKQLINGRSLELKEYVYNSDKSGERLIDVRSASVIFVEGVFALHFEIIRNLLDLKIFIETPEYLMLKRRIKRDAEERGYDLQDVLYRFEHHVMPSFEAYTLPSRKWADIIVPNHSGFSNTLNLISAYLS